ncbi:MAG TPA: hypothetical protein VK886_11095 [Vicinamibacterales bacterium]|nr:hypothetical protein [Vicinamibacterales bacterium]
MTRRDLLAGGMMSGSLFGDGEVQRDDAEDRRVSDVLRNILSEMQSSRRSPLAGDVQFVGTVRERMLEFLRSTNRWPEYIDVGPGVWFLMYDWHVRFGVQPAVTKLQPPDNHFGLTFMFTTLVLRQEQNRDYIGMAYDRER